MNNLVFIAVLLCTAALVFAFVIAFMKALHRIQYAILRWHWCNMIKKDARKRKQIFKNIAVLLDTDCF